MTATAIDPPAGSFAVDISAESLDKTAGLDQTGPVNLEKALRAHDRLGGHIVSGHVDGVGTVQRMAEVGESWELCILAPQALGRFMAFKGSITVNGVSLTVNQVTDLPDWLRDQHQPDSAYRSTTPHSARWSPVHGSTWRST